MDNKDNKRPIKRVVRMSPPSSTQRTNNSNHINSKKRSKLSNKKTKRQKSNNIGVRTLKGTFAVLGKTILTVFLILIILLCIGGTALTVFVMQYVNSDSKYDLHSLDKSYTSVIYGENSAKEKVEITTMSAKGKRIWIESDQIPEHVKDAMMCAEDKDFKDHEGVVWARTMAAFIDEYIFDGKLPFTGGASTITQQLIKNINQDFYNRGADEKVREILGSLNLERNYTKDEILVAYLNYISLGNNVIGIEAGAQYYYGKTTAELTIAQAASLAAITKSPAYNFPTKDPNYKANDKPQTKTNNENNKERRTWILNTMLSENKITQEEFDQAVNEDIVKELVDHSKDKSNEDNNGIYSWAVDATIKEVAEDLHEKHGYSKEEALAKVMGGGLQINTKINPDIQKQLQSLFAVDKLFGKNSLENSPDAAMCIMDYDGNIIAQMGSRHPKTTNIGFNVISDGGVNMGSALKPLVAYAPAMKDDRIYWDQQRIDEPKLKLNNKTPTKNWPNNWNNQYSGPISIVDAVKLSKNTIPVELVEEMGVNKTMDWLENELGFTTIDRGSDFYSTALGNFHNGVHIDEVTAGYLMFGNDGYYHEPKNYVTVYDSNGNLLLDQSNDGKRVLDNKSAFIMNRLLRAVVTSGTGTRASLDNMGIEVVGKTGTGEKVGLSFVGATPYHVTSLWLGYQDSREFNQNLVYQPAQVWKNIMSEIYKGYKPANFDYLDRKGVVERNGGYYKK